ncbi:3-oxoadipate enol-lactonase 2 [Serratia quinivorans]|uniref:alpha/beta fold hydrolase n=1 Tax=Serratia quinivorans TaxID=137545 RepID=UPI00217A7461|nr:alpha/beta hydrolase [Serratia quinivorans]CAI0834622.1 3-oxoadipate enol-lactonase 2 [Serratia quinivorans]CAI0901955.1 3-oxoadipate enol-lactonase 2 [Serratia quinivorans]CAI1626185.1 3-oxoadipate enol-lactonase 2 [Serratia quinivorans]CAI2066502.1 3-oxoadipate enol-lactonase 2 [Serratia quinivorans]CAI2431476.1 3-oxoadipate enol-lactonase 2 [Serratia quinivorans]
MTTFNVNGINLSCDSFGDSQAEPLILIAGLGTQMIRWPVMFCERLVAKGYRVIRFDNRDAGCSSHFTHFPTPDFNALAAALSTGQRPNVAYTLFDMAADVIGLLDALEIPRAHLVGRSMGGMIAQIAASEYPERVLSLTSIMSSTGNPSLPSASPEVMAMLTQPAPNPFDDERGFLEHRLAFARRIASPGYPFDEQYHRALILEETQRAYDPGSFGRQIAAIAVAGDLRPLLARITAPSLIVHGADDALVPVACGRDTASSIQGSEFLLIDGMGHDLPASLFQTVADGIDRVARRSINTGTND